MSDVEFKLVAAWRRAAADWGFRFTSPFTLTAGDGRRFEYLGLVHQFGGRIGIMIRLIDRASSQPHYPVDEDYTVSELGEGYAEYDRQLFIDTLDDWQWLGPEAERPAWYSGKSWS